MVRSYKRCMDAISTTNRKGTPLTISHQIVIYRSPGDVFNHLADRAFAGEWFAHLRVAGGSAAPAPMRTVFYPGRYVAYRDRAATLPTYGDFRITAVPGGTRLQYVASVELIGAWRLAAPVLRLTGARRIVEALRALRADLESAPVLVPA